MPNGLIKGYMRWARRTPAYRFGIRQRAKGRLVPGVHRRFMLGSRVIASWGRRISPGRYNR